MDQKTIKLWGEYKGECQMKLEKLEDANEKVKRYVEKQIESWGLDEYIPFMGNPGEQIMQKAEERFNVQKSELMPTFEGFMDWLENKLTKKK